LLISHISLPVTNTPTVDSEKTQILHGFEKTTEVIIRFLHTAEDSMNICADHTWPSVAMGVEVFKKGLYELKKRNIKSRFVTDITKDNIKYCKELMQISELRHLDGLKGNFAISEKGYTASATLQEAAMLQEVIYSNARAILDQQQYMFETLWSKAKPAEQKIREIEDGVDFGKTEIIQSPKKILELFLNMIKSAKSEILLMLPTINAFLREERIGAIELLKKSAAEHNVNVRIITPSNNDVEKILQKNTISSTAVIKEQKGNQKKEKGFEVQRSNIQFKETAMTTVTILVVDKRESLVMEKTDDSKENFIEAIGLSTYSDSEPTVMSYLSIFEGLWRQAKLYEELREANEQLQIHDKMQKEFINIASHEMKTPTQAILGTSGLLQYYPERKDELIEIIKRNAKRLQTLIANILDVTRIESQTLILNKERFNIRDIISSLIEDYKDRTKNSNIEINNNNNNNPIFIEADKDRIIQVLSNLLSNAIKFTDQGQISINLFEKNDDNHGDDGKRKEVIVSVTDTGSGINSEIFTRLFSKFASKSYQGTGLGLFICKSIVEAHGGRIWAENKDVSEDKSSGATITFSLPTVSDINTANGDN
jgi:two-component system, OmpR family, sensor histidine kinase VicK